MAPAELRLEPRLLRAIFTFDDVAVNLYHTSSSGIPLAHPAGIAPLAVAPHTVPELFVVPTANVVAAEHSSFEGGGDGCVTQILKSSVVPLPEGFDPTFDTLT